MKIIAGMKNTLNNFKRYFALHPAYEEHFEQVFLLFCPSSSL